MIQTQFNKLSMVLLLSKLHLKVFNILLEIYIICSLQNIIKYRKPDVVPSMIPQGINSCTLCKVCLSSPDSLYPDGFKMNVWKSLWNNEHETPAELDLNTAFKCNTAVPDASFSLKWLKLRWWILTSWREYQPSVFLSTCTMCGEV